MTFALKYAVTKRRRMQIDLGLSQSYFAEPFLKKHKAIVMIMVPNERAMVLKLHLSLRLLLKCMSDVTGC